MGCMGLCGCDCVHYTCVVILRGHKGSFFLFSNKSTWQKCLRYPSNSRLYTHTCMQNKHTHLKAETKDRRACRQQKRDCAHATSFSRKLFNSCKRETALSFLTEKPFSFWHRTAASTLALTNRAGTSKVSEHLTLQKSLTFKLQCSSLVMSGTLHIFK